MTEFALINMQIYAVRPPKKSNQVIRSVGGTHDGIMKLPLCIVLWLL